MPPSLAPATVPEVILSASSDPSPLPLPVNVLVPISMLPKLDDILPAARAPTVVKLLVTTFAPRLVASRTLVSAILYSLVLIMLTCSLKSQQY